MTALLVCCLATNNVAMGWNKLYSPGATAFAFTLLSHAAPSGEQKVLLGVCQVNIRTISYVHSMLHCSLTNLVYLLQNWLVLFVSAVLY